MNVEAVMTALLAAAVVGSVPLMLAAVGEAIGERAGLLNLGIEGVMLTGGLVGFWLALRTGSPEAGLALGALAGAACGVMFGVLATVGRADQIVLGLGITLAGAGGTAFLFREIWGSEQPLLTQTMWRPLAGQLDWLPVIGPAIGNQRWAVFGAWGLVAFAQWYLVRTRHGLRIRAAGEFPLGLEASGASVSLVRIQAATIAGAASGLAGAFLTTVELGLFSSGVTMGAGFIAVALAMLSRRQPWRVAVFALLFGLLSGLDTGLQIAGVNVRSEFLHMVPYLGIVVALIVLGRDPGTPAALGQVWRGLAGRR